MNDLGLISAHCAYSIVCQILILCLHQGDRSTIYGVAEPFNLDLMSLPEFDPVNLQSAKQTNLMVDTRMSFNWSEIQVHLNFEDV